MKHSYVKIPGKFFWPLVLTFFLAVLTADAPSSLSQEKEQHQIDKAKIFQEFYPLISESDLYCSFFVLEDGMPQIQIIAAEREEEKILLSDADMVYVDKGSEDGLEIGQVFLALEIGPKVGHPAGGETYGLLALKRGRARIVFLEDHRGVARIEKTCGQLMVGQYLVPFEEKEGLLGKDSGFEIFEGEGTGIRGQIVYIDTDLNIAATSHWALINLGTNDGVFTGQQMTIFNRVKKDMPRQAVGNLVVIDAQQRTSTVKILSCRDALEIGFEVQAK